MSELVFSTVERLAPLIQQGEIEACEQEVSRMLRELPGSPFHCALDLSIANRPDDAARHFDRFFRSESRRMAIAAAYTEVNDFDINPDRWFCDLFAYDTDGGHGDYDWLADWQSERFEEYEVYGLERLQQVYAGEASAPRRHEDAREMCSLLVVIKFQAFMQNAASHMHCLHFPLYATAHDYDFIADVRAVAS